jgi:WD40 repeat protein
MTDLPAGGKGKLDSSMKPFKLNLTLPSRSINNAITILPSWPRGWAMRRAEWKRAYAGYARGLDELDDSDDGDGEDGEDDDEYMDYLEEEEDESLSPASSVATYPNTIPSGLRRLSGAYRSQPTVVTKGRESPASVSSTRSRRRRIDEPRILVSNNDKTVKMFSLRRVGEDDERVPPRERASSEWERELAPTSALRRTEGGDPRYRDGRALPPLPPLPPRRALFGSSLGYDGIGLNEGILAQDLRSPPTPPPRSRAEDVTLRGSRYLGESLADYRARMPGGERDDRIWARMRAQRRADLEAQVGLTPPIPPPQEGDCKLSSIGGQRFKLAVNHSSLSPDLRTMVTVGDSTDVYLHEVLDGGQGFRRIGVYNAATDSGFSTSWSRDGRRFAVASQDGQVTVWDHRSSRPLAIFHTQPQGARYTEFDERAMEPPVGSQSGLEAARVVKFSPEGASRDLLVFSEELTRIHIVDARTFQTHVCVEVPYEAAGVTPSPSRRPRRGVDGGLYGISGIAFDPSGDWLYAGTERTLVEWDLRRYGGGEGGTWSMA